MGTKTLIWINFRQTKKREREKRKEKLNEDSSACYKSAIKATGVIRRSENSLNQHIKLKHPEFWLKAKAMDKENSEQSSDLNSFKESDDR